MYNEIQIQSNQPRVLKNLLLMTQYCLDVGTKQLSSRKSLIPNGDTLELQLCRRALELAEESKGHLVDEPDILPEYKDYPEYEPGVQLVYVS